MANTVRNNGTIAKAAQNNAVANKQPQTVKEFVMAYKGQFEKALSGKMSAEQFTRIALTALQTTPKLNDCEPGSIIAALLTTAQLALEPNTPLGQAYIIPYGKRAELQIGYRGLLDIAYRSGMMQSIQAHVVYANDEFEFEFGLDAKCRHIPAKSNRGEAEWVYAVFKTVNGGTGFEVMSMEDIRAHAQRFSKTFNNGPWQTNFEEMAKKTVIKRLLKYAPLTTEVARAAASDEHHLTLTIPNDGSEVLTNVDYEVVEDGTGAEAPVQ